MTSLVVQDNEKADELVKNLVQQGNFLALTMAENEDVIPLTPMGVLTPESAHVRPSAQPPRREQGGSMGQIMQQTLFKISLMPMGVLALRITR